MFYLFTSYRQITISQALKYKIKPPRVLHHPSRAIHTRVITFENVLVVMINGKKMKIGGKICRNVNVERETIANILYLCIYLFISYHTTMNNNNLFTIQQTIL